MQQFISKFEKDIQGVLSGSQVLIGYCFAALCRG
jgi:hypothetical protein